MCFVSVRTQTTMTSRGKSSGTGCTGTTSCGTLLPDAAHRDKMRHLERGTRAIDAALSRVLFQASSSEKSSNHDDTPGIPELENVGCIVRPVHNELSNWFYVGGINQCQEITESIREETPGSGRENAPSGTPSGLAPATSFASSMGTSHE
ncbi:hypothetical protein C8R46DRAFT_1301655 [Mycena filopes]|nr:hypothetical protein C8R46DRAFT_1301655 [Mycena filopes]